MAAQVACTLPAFPPLVFIGPTDNETGAFGALSPWPEARAGAVLQTSLTDTKGGSWLPENAWEPRCFLERRKNQLGKDTPPYIYRIFKKTTQRKLGKNNEDSWWAFPTCCCWRRVPCVRGRDGSIGSQGCTFFHGMRVSKHWFAGTCFTSQEPAL